MTASRSVSNELGRSRSQGGNGEPPPQRSFVPRVPLTAAEQHTDFVALDAHILRRRVRVETAARPVARRLAHLIVELPGAAPLSVLRDLEARLAKELELTARFGFREAQREVKVSRSGGESRQTVAQGAASSDKARSPSVVLAYAIRDAGRFSELARLGLEGVILLIGQRAGQTASAVAAAAAAAQRENADADTITQLVAVLTAAQKQLHLNVLEMIGETLNMGRAAGVLALPEPPEFAFRSEQLDKATCDACTTEHGGIYQVDSPEYYAHLPPSFCYGGGRCRGIMVFGDEPSAMRKAA